MLGVVGAVIALGALYDHQYDRLYISAALLFLEMFFTYTRWKKETEA